MKQKIDPKDILKGDLIRVEYDEESYPRVRKDRATEHRAIKDGDTFRGHRYPTGVVYYLLERPEPPFEPYWGMVIGDPHISIDRAVYLPWGSTDRTPWMRADYDSRGRWVSNEWVKQKLAEGWVVIEKPEGVK